MHVIDKSYTRSYQEESQVIQSEASVSLSNDRLDDYDYTVVYSNQGQKCCLDRENDILLLSPIRTLTRRVMTAPMKLF
jgi:hypothetical protein